MKMNNPVECEINVQINDKTFGLSLRNTYIFNQIRRMQKSDKEIVLENHVRTFVGQETLCLAITFNAPLCVNVIYIVVK